MKIIVAVEKEDALFFISLSLPRRKERGVGGKQYKQKSFLWRPLKMFSSAVPLFAAVYCFYGTPSLKSLIGHLS
jgi:hypothetical protein